jgi:hypothetical protein
MSSSKVALLMELRGLVFADTFGYAAPRTALHAVSVAITLIRPMSSSKVAPFMELYGLVFPDTFGHAVPRPTREAVSSSVSARSLVRFSEALR